MLLAGKRRDDAEPRASAARGSRCSPRPLSAIVSVQAVMANPITDAIKTGTVGELLVQLRLLQYDVQAAPPLKDSGNDLIALRGFVVRTIQVKTTTDALPVWPPEARLYHLLAVVRLEGEDRNLWLDKSEIFLVPKRDLPGLAHTWEALQPFALSEAHVSKLFAD